MKLWLIRDKDNHVSGPFEEKEICSLIIKGGFDGEEEISSYPSGKWKPISSHLAFHKAFLEALEPDSDKSDFFEEEPIEPTVIIEKPKEPKKTPERKKVKIKLESDEDENVEEESDVIEMKDVRQVFLKKLKKSLALPALAISLLLIIYYFLSTNSNNSKQKKYVRILSPKINESEFFRSLKKSRKIGKRTVIDWDRKVQKNFVEYFKDDINSYLNAQGKMIEILEENPNIPLGYYQLCLVHLELWPFTRQDYKDKRVLSKVFGYVSQLDKGGVYSGLCSATMSLSENQYETALRYIDSSIEALASINESPAFFHYLKAFALWKLNRISEAISYAQSSYRLLPKWIRPQMLEAEVFYQEKKYLSAAKIYKRISKQSSSHISSQLRLGIIEFKNFKNYKKSEKRLRVALSKSYNFIDSSILAEARFVLAQNLFKQNDKEEALKNIKIAYSLDPSNAEILQFTKKMGVVAKLAKSNVNTRQLIYKGDVFRNERNCIQAQALYKKAYELDRNRNALAAVQMAKCYWMMGISGQAVHWLKKAIKADSQRMEAYFLLADYLSKNHAFDSAKEVLKAAQQQKINHYEVFKGFAIVALRQKNYKAAIIYAKRSLKFYTSDVRVYTILSEASRNLKEYSEAYDYATKAIEEDVNNIDGQTNLAIALGLAYGFSRGENRFKQLIETYPSITEYQQALGKYYYNDDKYEQSLNVFTQIINQKPEFKEAYIYLGRIYTFYGERDKDADKYQKAIQSFIKAILLDPSDPSPSFYMGQTYMANKQYLEAENQFEKTLALNGNYPLIHYYIGKVNFLQGGEENLNRALQSAKTEYQKNPNLALAYVLAGDVYKSKANMRSLSSKRRAHYELCATEYQKALKIRPKDIFLSIGLIECYRGSGDVDASLQIINKLLNSPGMSGYPELYREAGYVYEIKKEYEKAKASYNQYFSLFPTAPERATIERRLRKIQ